MPAEVHRSSFSMRPENIEKFVNEIVELTGLDRDYVESKVREVLDNVYVWDRPGVGTVGFKVVELARKSPFERLVIRFEYGPLLNEHNVLVHAKELELVKEFIDPEHSEVQDFKILVQVREYI